MLPGRLRIAPNVVLKLYPTLGRPPAQLATTRRVTAPARLCPISSPDCSSCDEVSTSTEEQTSSGEDELSDHNSISGNPPLQRSPVSGLRIDIPPPCCQNVVVTASDESAPATPSSRDGEGNTLRTEPACPRVYRLQQGTSGISWGAQEERSGRIISLKAFRKDHVNQSLQNSLGMALERELKAYQRISSFTAYKRGMPFIMEIERSMQNMELVCFSMRFMACSLLDYIHFQPERCLLNAAQWTAQLALAIDTLHNMGIMHRNLKAEHVLIDPRENVRVADFGHAFLNPRGSLHRWGAYTTEPVGKGTHMAPEMLRNTSVSSDKMKPYGIAVDWWGLGLLLFELVSEAHKPLFAVEGAVYGYIAWHKEFRGVVDVPIYPRFRGLSPEIVTVLAGLLRVSSSHRYSLAELQQRGYFKNSDGLSEFSNAGARALQRPIRQELAPQSVKLGTRRHWFVPGHASQDLWSPQWEWVNRNYRARDPTWCLRQSRTSVDTH